MKYADYLTLPIWQELSDDQKLNLVDDVLLACINSKIKWSNVRVETLILKNQECRTIAITLDGDEFIFIPSITDWELGSSLESSSLEITTLPKAWHCLEGELFSHSPQRLGSTSPMFVAQKSQPAGVKLKGHYHLVRGEYQGDQAFFDLFKGEIKEVLQPDLDFLTSLIWEFPTHYLKPKLFYLEQQVLNPEVYDIYSVEVETYGELLLRLYRQGYQLLSEDAWEAVLGSHFLETVKQRESTGLVSEVSEKAPFELQLNSHFPKFELTDQDYCRKLKIYLGSTNKLSLAFSEWPTYQKLVLEKELAGLNPCLYDYRKAIIIM
ncbi:DUF7278 family profilin-like fold-containing protein [Vagococcus intermedius]|uniref:DUF7278 domain-containing protein n=1 Tax=Vagococcus intermedius TaxID=2991418 RepID=A0AAF0CU16_9ENTE|nr:hypothetical protein [Vagococcus intermedius]WEG72712.1 hypothetical protein OL234_06900 [Vagococcus intermedius]WEG74797.1 hypothetical protein OL235_06895 [Vagococcus intermedius]